METADTFHADKSNQRCRYFLYYSKSKEKGTDYKCLGDLWHHRVRGRSPGDRAGAQPEEHHGEHRVQLQLLRAHHVPGREPRRGKEEAAKKIDNWHKFYLCQD